MKRLILSILLLIFAISCGGGGGGSESATAPSQPSAPPPTTYSLSPEQATMVKDYGNPEYLTISVNSDTGRREESWTYQKLNKMYIYWDGERVKEQTLTLNPQSYSKPPYIDPSLFSSATKKADILKLFGSKYKLIDQSTGNLSFQTWYYKDQGVSVSFAGDLLVVVQTLDKP